MIRIEKIKEDINSKKGKELHFHFKGSRGQVDDFDGFITDTFNGVFLVRSSSNDRVKSFSYSDILINNLSVDVKRD